MKEEELPLDLIKMIESMVDSAFDGVYNRPVKTSNKEYADIEDYTQKTGKRFRVLKEQKERGLSREDAFRELFPKS